VTSSTRELLLGDTSFVSAWAQGDKRLELVRDWPLELARLVSSATVAISSVTFAEVRHGHRVANWGERRVRTAERWLRSFVQFPVDVHVAETWARLKATGQRRGRSFGTNDLWIAATGCTRDLPVVTCDRDFLPMRELGVRVIYLPRTGGSRTA
jgi:predicted nucleic acid-binding protein